MNGGREMLSLCGRLSLLIAMGGSVNGEETRVCEKYKVNQNKWECLPSLNTPRADAGAVLLNSMDAFCFGGILSHKSINSIESLQTEIHQRSWVTLAINPKI